MYTFAFTDSAMEDVRYLTKAAQTMVLSEIEVQLLNEPLKETRNRKPLRPNALADWELRAGVYRVFYDVDDAAHVVKVKAIGWKEHNALFIRGREFKL